MSGAARSSGALGALTVMPSGGVSNKPRALPVHDARVTVAEAAAVFVAGVAAGTVNTVGGSGTLITFPVLLAVGSPSVVANVSNTVGLAPGLLARSVGYRREPRAEIASCLIRCRIARRRRSRSATTACAAGEGAPLDRSGVHRARRDLDHRAAVFTSSRRHGRAGHPVARCGITSRSNR